MQDLTKLHNIGLHIILAQEVEKTPFGQITVNVEVKDGKAVLSTLNIVKQRRRKYQLDKTIQE